MIAPGSSTAYVALGALTPSIASSSCRQEDKLSNDGLFVFLRRTEAELGHLGASPFSLGASPCKAFFAAVHGRFHRLQFAFSSALCLAGWTCSTGCLSFLLSSIGVLLPSLSID